MRYYAIDDSYMHQDRMQASFQEVSQPLDWRTTIEEILTETHRLDTALVLLSSKFEGNLYEACDSLASERPNMTVVVLDSDLDLDLRRLMRAGVFDVLSHPIHGRDLRAVMEDSEKKSNLKRQSTESDESEPKKRSRKGKVLTVCSTKGGVGKTTLVVNVASAYSKLSKKVLVIDLDLQFGDVSMFFNQKPSKTIYEWVKENPGGNPKSIQPYVSKVNEQVHFIAAPTRPEFSEVITDQHIDLLIEEARYDYDLVIIDTAPFMEGAILTALEGSDEVFLLTILDLPTLKNTNMFMDTLESIKLREKVKVLVTRETKRNGLKGKTAEQILNTTIYRNLPDAPKVVMPSVNEGQPFVVTQPKSKIAKAIYKITNDLDPSEEKEMSRKWIHKSVLAGRRA